MPIVAYNNIPSLGRIQKEGLEILNIDKAKNQDIRELHIGFLNMMPDPAFLATERQFFRLAATATNIVQIYIHPINCQNIDHKSTIQKHVNKYYKSFEEVKKQGLDAIIVTGANPRFANLDDEPYWQEATTIFDWAKNNVCSVFFSCLASHALLKAQCGIQRIPLKQKLWGIYSHHITDKKHPLVSNLNTKFDMPHSRKNDISATQLKEYKLKILVLSEQAGVSIATSNDGFKQVFCQGHPEYDTTSLFKEYKREIQRYLDGKRKDYPNFPENYGNSNCLALINTFKYKLINQQTQLKNFPDKELINYIDNTWRDTAKALFSNWIGLVYKTTSYDRKAQFMENIDPNNPLAQWY